MTRLAGQVLPSADQIATWLKNNPKFFEDYAGILADIHIPHPHGGRAISINERQVLTLRQKNKVLESRLAEMIQLGQENEAIANKIHHLSAALIGADSLDAVLGVVYTSLREAFSVPHVALRLWGFAPDRDGHVEFAPVLDELKQFVANAPGPHCGQHAVYETQRWFGEVAPHLRSFALIPLKGQGLLALAAEDAQRFYPEMGTLYLKRLGDLVSAGLARYLQPA
jgi:uncharacterized protein